MPCTRPSPNRPASSGVTGSTRSRRAPPEEMKGAASKEQSDREQRSGEDLQTRRRSQHGKERSTLLIAQRQPERGESHRERQERQERPRPIAGQDPDRERHAHEREAVEQSGPPPSEAHRQRLLARLG